MPMQCTATRVQYRSGITRGCSTAWRLHATAMFLTHFAVHSLVRAVQRAGSMRCVRKFLQCGMCVCAVHSHVLTNCFDFGKKMFSAVHSLRVVQSSAMWELRFFLLILLGHAMYDCWMYCTSFRSSIVCVFILPHASGSFHEKKKSVDGYIEKIRK